MTPQKNQRNKIYIVGGIAVLSAILIVGMLLQGNSKDKNIDNTLYSLDGRYFSYSIPKDFEVTSSTPESITSTYVGDSENLKNSSIEITRFIKKDSSSDDISKLKGLLELSNLPKDDLKVVVLSDGTRLLLDSINGTMSKIYGIKQNYIWLITINATNKESLDYITETSKFLVGEIEEK
ncbi:MAG: hypothetical protein H6799_00795 [Candidatus Nomurabacteria bacterium]|nr:MAG: hypothetical protein H6799_00795 [Candidatus Nomurabacteria bacterium]HRV76331.1 hypothetical protein [Candidatus Saccharimonadales bacterium]